MKTFALSFLSDLCRITVKVIAQLALVALLSVAFLGSVYIRTQFKEGQMSVHTHEFRQGETSTPRPPPPNESDAVKLGAITLGETALDFGYGRNLPLLQ